VEQDVAGSSPAVGSSAGAVPVDPRIRRPRRRVAFPLARSILPTCPRRGTRPGIALTDKSVDWPPQHRCMPDPIPSCSRSCLPGRPVHNTADSNIPARHASRCNCRSQSDRPLARPPVTLRTWRECRPRNPSSARGRSRIPSGRCAHRRGPTARGPVTEPFVVRHDHLVTAGANVRNRVGQGTRRPERDRTVGDDARPHTSAIKWHLALKPDRSRRIHRRATCFRHRSPRRSVRSCLCTPPPDSPSRRPQYPAAWPDTGREHR